jgi:predicted secreted protein
MSSTPTTKYKLDSDHTSCSANEPEITVVAHCLLNPYTRVKGLRPVQFRPGGPVIQLPCPEALYMGLDRWAVTRNQLDVPEFRRFCRSLIVHYADLLEMLARQGKRIKIVGLAGSPSCGLETTSLGYAGGRVHEVEHEHVAGKGVFMEELIAELERRGIPCAAEEVGQKRLSETEFGSLPEIAPFQREEIDRFE